MDIKKLIKSKGVSKKVLCIIISLLIVVLLVILFVVKPEYKIVDRESFDVSKIDKITFVNGDERIVLTKSDDEFESFVNIFNDKKILSGDAFEFGYNDYKFILSNTFSSVELTPSTYDLSSSFIQVGKTDSLTGLYDYIHLSQEERNMILNIIKEYEDEHNIEHYVHSTQAADESVIDNE